MFVLLIKSSSNVIELMGIVQLNCLLEKEAIHSLLRDIVKSVRWKSAKQEGCKKEQSLLMLFSALEASKDCLAFTWYLCVFSIGGKKQALSKFCIKQLTGCLCKRNK